jgi:hypothetical protein
MLDLSQSVRQALGQCDEHWNGKTGVLGLQGEQISVHARLFRLAQDVDVFHRLGGMYSAVTMATGRSGTYYDPSLVALFVSHAPELDARLAVGSLWDAVQAAEPDPARILDWHEFDELARKLATVIDMRSRIRSVTRRRSRLLPRALPAGSASLATMRGRCAARDCCTTSDGPGYPWTCGTSPAH